MPDTLPQTFSSLVVLAAVAIVSGVVLRLMLFSRKWDPNGRHCLVTGGSSGTGLALALLLAHGGAHVSIIARNTDKLNKALEQLEAAHQNSKQILKAYLFTVDSEAGSQAALQAVSSPHDGRCPDALFPCTGASKPAFFVDQNEESMRAGMQMTYWAQAFTALVSQFSSNVSLFPALRYGTRRARKT
ncbi:hypothetical protein C8Q77DRAFT_621077 [Trametes polyzona]|nr:hypothetical protein C8Q77DRAFT_621077 [Trametes polyzona]